MEQASYMRRVLLAGIVILSCVFSASLNVSGSTNGDSNNSEPEALQVEIIANYSHDANAFTQGLAFHSGDLYESTGLYGNSTIRQVNLSSGEVVRSMHLNDSYFGEGLAVVGDTLVQLTWKNNTALVWDVNDFSLLNNYSYQGEGWGLCFNGTNLIMSNGTSSLSVRSTNNFSIIRTIEVTNNGSAVSALNELECTANTVWANVWGETSFVGINSSTGLVEQIVNAEILLAEEYVNGSGVLNGIALDDETGTMYLTGKNWPKLFAVNLVEETLDSSQVGQNGDDNDSESANNSGDSGPDETPLTESTLTFGVIGIILMLIVLAMIILSIALLWKLSRP